MKHVAIVMPVFNEDEGIAEFIEEICTAFSETKFSICVVDDFSTDNTPLKLSELTQRYENISTIRNRRNLGHGPSTIKALELGLQTNADIVLSVDGDGQFLAGEMLEFLAEYERREALYAEGIRNNRKDPWFRKIISFTTRVIVLLLSCHRTRDANTPCRIYDKATLSLLLSKISNTAITPNLIISINARKMGIDVLSFYLTSIPRRGGSIIGSSWEKKSTFFPSSRLFVFCKNAIFDLARYHLKS